MNKTAIIVVDVQNDFVEGGALAVTGGKALVPVINEIIASIKPDVVAFTQDWHPEQTAHFDKWPQHCVAGTPGAQLVDGLFIPSNAIRVRKGTSVQDDGYSGFEGLTDGNITLHDALKAHGITTVYVVGIATDYCVRATALHAKRLGYYTVVLANACVGVAEPSTNDAIQEMKDTGVLIMRIG